ncbi:futalosine hydrolase [Syntrophotalea acetylenivorans]|uniref:Futalosine hydrolase n=1 Tax=Syntrophotalea acetylenivorans TaxID=1842532 RepID=A0A1L3GPW3_9BACT|nr:futalosine hydrolase [Syntrophotalea acetylenivorans]APG27991.1 futalosine hydrolase [Syntrophotalea acetylenivorans]
MIAIIAAVAAETALLRQSLSPCEVRRCGARELFLGSLFDQKVALLHSGIGKINAASAVTALLETFKPEAVIVTGCAGAYPDSGLEVGDLVLASEEILADEGVLTPQGFIDFAALGFPLLEHGGPLMEQRFLADPQLLAEALPLIETAAIKAGARLATGPLVTVSTCSGTDQAARAMVQRTAGIGENMEGAAVAQICRLYEVPFLELRGISNRVENRNLERWDLPAGAKIAQRALMAYLKGCHPPQESA